MSKAVLPMLLALSLQLTISAQAQTGFPSFQEVVKAYFSKYEFCSQCILLRFQKKKEGWVCAWEDDQPTHHIKMQTLFWAARDRTYLDVDEVPAKDTALQSRIEGYCNMAGCDAFTQADYRQYPYYGYNGYDWDIIRDYGKRPQLSDSLLEALARAYRSYAAGFFANMYGFQAFPDDPDRILLSPGQPVSKKRKKEFIEYVKQAQETYEHLRRQNPLYRSRINNDMLTECANNYMFANTELLFYGFRRASKQFLKPVQYPDTLLNRLRNGMDAAEKGSILMTNGDNAFYAALYLQQHDHYRRDLTVLNYNLLGGRQYLLYLYQRYKRAPLFTSTPAEFLDKRFDYGIIADSSLETLTVPAFFSSLKIGEDSFLRTTAGNIVVETLVPGEHGPTAASVTLRLPKYLISLDYIMLQIFEKAGRIIYFENRSDFKGDPSLQIDYTPHLKAKGPLYYLSPD